MYDLIERRSTRDGTIYTIDFDKDYTFMEFVDSELKRSQANHFRFEVDGIEEAIYHVSNKVLKTNTFSEKELARVVESVYIDSAWFNNQYKIKLKMEPSTGGYVLQDGEVLIRNTAEDIKLGIDKLRALLYAGTCESIMELATEAFGSMYTAAQLELSKHELKMFRKFTMSPDVQKELVNRIRKRQGDEVCKVCGKNFTGPKINAHGSADYIKHTNFSDNINIMFYGIKDMDIDEAVKMFISDFFRDAADDEEDTKITKEEAVDFLECLKHYDKADKELLVNITVRITYEIEKRFKTLNTAEQTRIVEIGYKIVNAIPKEVLKNSDMNAVVAVVKYAKDFPEAFETLKDFVK